MNRPSSSSDILTALADGGVKATVIAYRDLARVGSVDAWLAANGAMILLYPSNNAGVGHWTAVFKRGRGEIEFYDPLGNGVDTSFARLRYPPPRKLLARLLSQSRYKIAYNDAKLQRTARDIMTCGRHVVHRLLSRSLPIDTYISQMRRLRVSPDEFVTRVIKMPSDYQ